MLLSGTVYVCGLLPGSEEEGSDSGAIRASLMWTWQLAQLQFTAASRDDRPFDVHLAGLHYSHCTFNSESRGVLRASEASLLPKH